MLKDEKMLSDVQLLHKAALSNIQYLMMLW